MNMDEVRRKQYQRPLDLVNKEINRILKDDLQYLRGLEGIGQNYGPNDTYNQTLLVWEFINGEGTYPKFDESSGIRNEKTNAEGIRGEKTNAEGIRGDFPILPPAPPPPPPIFDGGKRRKSRKSRKSRKVRR